LLALQSVTELAAERQTILGLFLGGFVDEPTDLKNMDKLAGVEAKLIGAEFDTLVAKEVGRKILLDNDETPHDWDNFKADLFMRIQQFA
jgi:hypothetical protein